jgi:hypothetical protein
MKVADFAQILRQSINEKINQSRGDMHETHNPIYNQSLLIEIQALEWVQLQIQHLVNNNVRKEKSHALNNKIM